MDGTDAGALGVMSEGELPAFAPALRPPRVTHVGLACCGWSSWAAQVRGIASATIDGPVRVRGGLAAFGEVSLLLPRPAAAGYPRDGRATRVVELTSGLGSTVEIASVLDPPGAALPAADLTRAPERARLQPVVTHAAAWLTCGAGHGSIDQ